MRKIEQAMNKAIAQYSDWSQDNTRIEVKKDFTTVYLYGNKIAELGDNYITLFDGGFQSATTKSRLNAILSKNGKGDEHIYQKNYEWRISYDGKDETFVSGMTIGCIF